MTTGTRAPLSRGRILQAALEFVDRHGLAALSMHKLAAELGVKGMSLYNHVDGKDGLLDGIVETIWAEVALPEPQPTWQQDVRAFGQSLRDMVLRHPEAAPLLVGRRILPTPALRVFETYRHRLQDGGLSQARAFELMRAVISYAFGFALFEITWADDAMAVEADDPLHAFQHVSSLVPGGTPPHLLRLVMGLCVECDMNSQFNAGVDLMLGGLEATADPEQTAG